MIQDLIGLRSARPMLFHRPALLLPLSSFPFHPPTVIPTPRQRASALFYARLAQRHRILGFASLKESYTVHSFKFFFLYYTDSIAGGIHGRLPIAD